VRPAISEKLLHQDFTQNAPVSVTLTTFYFNMRAAYHCIRERERNRSITNQAPDLANPHRPTPPFKAVTTRLHPSFPHQFRASSSLFAAGASPFTIAIPLAADRCGPAPARAACARGGVGPGRARRCFCLPIYASPVPCPSGVSSCC
jgi:hypothetical protein